MFPKHITAILTTRYHKNQVTLKIPNLAQIKTYLNSNQAQRNKIQSNRNKTQGKNKKIVQILIKNQL